MRAVVGADSFLAERAIEGLVAAAIGDDRQQALEVLRGEESNWQRVLDAARSLSLFAPRRAVVVRRAEALKGDSSLLAGYLEDPTPELLLVLQFTKIDKRTSLYKKLKGRKAVEAADPLRGRKLQARVEEELRERGLRLEREALDELLELVGQDLRRLVGELDKLAALGIGPGASREEVAEVLGRGVARPRWELSDAIAARRAGRALELIDQLLDDGDYAPMLLGTLHRSLRRVRLVRALSQQRASAGEIASKARVPPFRVQDELRIARAWPAGGLESAMQALQVADTRLKTGADARVTLAAAVVEACGGDGAATRRAGR